MFRRREWMNATQYDKERSLIQENHRFLIPELFPNLQKPQRLSLPTRQFPQMATLLKLLVIITHLHIHGRPSLPQLADIGQEAVVTPQLGQVILHTLSVGRLDTASPVGLPTFSHHWRVLASSRLRLTRTRSVLLTVTGRLEFTDYFIETPLALSRKNGVVCRRSRNADGEGIVVNIVWFVTGRFVHFYWEREANRTQLIAHSLSSKNIINKNTKTIMEFREYFKQSILRKN